jgi:hypothetical protein
MNGGAIRAVNVAAMAATKLVHILTMVGAGQACIAYYNLPLLTHKPNLRRSSTFAWHGRKKF